MVKVAFIVEGDVERIMIDHLQDTGWFEAKGIEQVGPTIDAKGGGNLCPRNLSIFIDQAKVFKPDCIFVLTDLECDPCITKTKERIGDCDICNIIIARKAVEAWFLADTEIVSSLTKGALRDYARPEETSDMPYDTIKALMKAHTNRGPGSKVALAQKVMRSGFDIARSAAHAECSSASYFIAKIEAMAGE